MKYKRIPSKDLQCTGCAFTSGPNKCNLPYEQVAGGKPCTERAGKDIKFYIFVEDRK